MGIKQHSSQQFLQAVTENFLFSKTDKNGIITDLNDAFCESTGYGKQELLGRSHRILKHREMDTKEFARLWQTIRAKRVYRGMIKNRTKDNRTVFYNTTIIPIVKKSGKIKEFLALRHDMTVEIKALWELKEIIGDLNKKEQMMMHQSKLAQMGEMLSMIAHQWRQPLSAISSTTTDLNLKIALDAYDQNYFTAKLDNINRYADYLAKTVEDFRGFFKPDKQKSLTTIKAVVTSAMRIIATSLKNKNIRVTTRFEENTELFLYAGELQQVVLNLLKNAEDAILEKQLYQGCIQLRSFRREESVCLEVTDNAGGVPERIKEHIFEPYFSTKTDKDGTGLGLHMCRIIVHDHCKGTLGVRNENGGAVFRLCLPLTPSFTAETSA